ncbi:MAG: dual specificity protein kinase kns1 [Alyxoria varia]|nr:MAG: dual specificity protein kinase kns1 [Alyxoria varia]
MSTPSTATAIHPPHRFLPHYPNYQASASDYRPSNISIGASSRLAYNSFPAANSPVESPQQPNFNSKHDNTNSVMAHSQASSSCAESNKISKKADWNSFYRNGIPKEVIVIDDSPEPSQRSGQHPEKRRKVDNSTAYGPAHGQQGLKQDESISTSTGSSARTASAMYSTAPTSLTSQGSGGQKAQRVDESQAGQKRKRPQRNNQRDDSPGVEYITQNHSWSNYYPPPKPPVKASDVYVKPVRDRLANSRQEIDDDDGHYMVHPDSNLTERYHIIKLLGQGTFGKVVEAFDKEKKTRCAVKIIRAVPKYRDASRIELRVLSTLSSNDKHNRNRCIHLRDCFDFRNHVCIVTDLLGSSVFDFLKTNGFVPFPSTHIQSFARQLFTSVAFLHDLNLIHTDLKPENILLVSSSYQTFTYNRQIPSSTKSGQRHSKFRRVLLDPEIRLIDFGSATFDDEYHSTVVSTRHYRAPEIILNLGWSYPCDIWSIGCILVEFFTGDALFQTHDNLEHLAMMEAVCNAKIEKEIIQQVRNNSKGSSSSSSSKNAAAQFFPPRAYRLEYPNSETTKASRKYVKNMKRLDETIPPNGNFNKQFLDLLAKIFVYDPKKRITAKQALNHPWFKETLQDDGTEAIKIRLSNVARRA